MAEETEFEYLWSEFFYRLKNSNVEPLFDGEGNKHRSQDEICRAFEEMFKDGFIKANGKFENGKWKEEKKQ